MNIEKWVIIKGFELYQVSSLGRIKNRRTGHILNTRLDTKGYLRVNLRDNACKKTSKNIHALVASAFIPKASPDLIVNHKDGNKLNNVETNLEWVTYSENLKHAYALGLKKKIHCPINLKIEISDIINNETLLFSSILQVRRYFGTTLTDILTIIDSHEKNPYLGQYIFRKIKRVPGRRRMTYRLVDLERSCLITTYGLKELAKLSGVGQHAIATAINNKKLVNGCFVWSSDETEYMVRFGGITETEVKQSIVEYAGYLNTHTQTYTLYDFVTRKEIICLNSYREIAEFVNAKKMAVKEYFKTKKTKAFHGYYMEKNI